MASDHSGRRRFRASKLQQRRSVDIESVDNLTVTVAMGGSKVHGLSATCRERTTASASEKCSTFTSWLKRSPPRMISVTYSITGELAMRSGSY